MNLKSVLTKITWRHIVFFMSIILFYILNAIAPILRDDFTYSFYFNPPGFNFDYTHPINNIKDVFLSQWLHFFYWGGRAIVHVLAQLFCGILGKSLYDILATIMFAFWTIFFCKICFPSLKKKYLLSSSLILSFLFFFYINEPLVFYAGLTHSLNYLYTSLLCLIFIYFFTNDNFPSTKYHYISIPLLGFFAGWGHEAMSVGTSVLLFFISVQFYYQKKLKRIHLISLILFFIGVALCLFAPGNFRRVEINHTNRLLLLIELIVSYDNLFIFIAILLMFWKNGKLFKLFVKTNYPFILAWIISILFIAATGQPIKRSLFSIDFFSFIMLTRMFEFSGYSKKLLPRIQILSISFGLLLLLIIYYEIPAVNQYKYIYKSCQNESKSDEFITLNKLETPKWMIGRFIIHYQGYHANFWNKVYSQCYQKNIYTNCYDDRRAFVSGKKIKGNNSFYQIGDYLYTKEKMPDTISVMVYYGNYNAENFFSLIKKIAASLFFKKNKNKKQTNHYLVEKTHFSPENFVQWIYIGGDNTPRNIISMDLINTE